MSSIHERLQLKRVHLDPWNLREQLCLASVVARNGDQNWAVVSRAMKALAEPNRPADWYTQKTCATQYNALLENLDVPKRKKRNSEGGVDNPQENIIKHLTQERIAEIEKTVEEMTQQYEQLKNEILEVRNPSTSEDRIRDIWSSMEAEKRAREKENAKRAAWLKEREERLARAEKNWKPPQVTTPTPPATPVQPGSPLLTSLLKSSPVVTTPQHMSHPANVVDTMSPSVTAPTLSMLLEKSAPSPTAHESKHAAIELIKNEFLELEHKLIAAGTPPAVPVTAVPAVDIDDIEIKAEDVYAFRDIDIHIPPVGTIHKTTNRNMEKPTLKKDDVELTPPPVIQPEVAAEQTDEEFIKVVNIEVESTQGEEEVVQDVEMQSVETPPCLQEEAAPPQVVEDTNPEAEVRLPIPEVKFPTTEIKVIQPEEQQQVKEDTVKDAEPEVAVESEVKAEVPEVVEEEKLVEEEREEQTVKEEEVQEAPITQVEAEQVEPIIQPKEEIEEVVQEPNTSQEPEELVASEPVEEKSVPAVEDVKNDPEVATNEIETVKEEEIDTKVEIIEEVEEIKEETKNDVAEDTEALKVAEITNETNENTAKEEPQLQEQKPEVPVQEIKEEVSLETQNENVEAVVVNQTEVVDEIADKGNEERKDLKKEEIIEETNVVEVKKDEDAEDSIPLKQMMREENVSSLKEEIHTETDDDTPMELSREEEKDGKKKRDYSRKKKSDSRTCSGSESAPDSPGGHFDQDKQHRMWKKSVMLVYNRLCAHKYASLFLRPITDDEAPGYSMVIKRPMDLTAIRRNIDSGGIRTTTQFQRDVLLMLSNALMYNSSEHSVYAMAKEMHGEAQHELNMLLAIQAHAEYCAAPPARRKRRRPDSPLLLPSKRHHSGPK